MIVSRFAPYKRREGKMDLASWQLRLYPLLFVVFLVFGLFLSSALVNQALETKRRKYLVYATLMAVIAVVFQSFLTAAVVGDFYGASMSVFLLRTLLLLVVCSTFVTFASIALSNLKRDILEMVGGIACIVGIAMFIPLVLVPIVKAALGLP